MRPTQNATRSSCSRPGDTACIKYCALWIDRVYLNILIRRIPEKFRCHSCTTSSLLQFFQCTLRFKSDPQARPPFRFSLGKALQSYGENLNWPNFSELFFQNFRTFSETSLLFLVSPRRCGYFLKAGAKVDTFSFPSKFFTNFFHQKSHQKPPQYAQASDNHSHKTLKKNQPNKNNSQAKTERFSY